MHCKYLMVTASLFTASVRAGAQLCGQYQSEVQPGGTYTLFTNLWGENGFTGSQCSQVTSASATSVAWKTSWNWSGGPYSVKSYSNINLNVGLNKQLSVISSIPTTWDWTYTSASNPTADVSYDLWLSKQSGSGAANSASTYEIMVWLSTRGGAGPVGSQVASVTIDGIAWKVYKGPVQNWICFSFVAPSELTSFNADLLPFFTYLVKSWGVPSSQYLVSVASGTEPFTGSASLTTTKFSVAINTGGTPATTTPAHTTTKASTSSSGCTASHWAQCGGTGYTGCTTCVSGTTCQYSSAWYSQCL